MLHPRRAAPIFGFAAFLSVLLVLQLGSNRDSWRDIPQVVGLGDVLPDSSPSSTLWQASPAETGSRKLGGWDPTPLFAQGSAKIPGSNYSRILVMPRLQEEDVAWVEEELPEIEAHIYVVDDPTAPLHPPKNKGHEVMVYLTYIVDNYERLPDVSIFMHSHRWSWHNNDLINNDAVEMIRRLSSERVQREGYMNMRCHWTPGCPGWMHPGVTEVDPNKQEERMLAKCWSELFPHDPIPDVLAQPCCAQFALSRGRIRAIPKSRFVFYRDWLLQSELSDYLSGRVWEYIWQVIFTAQPSFCPIQHVCYCDGFGVCFGDEDRFEKWFEIRHHRGRLQSQLDDWQTKARAIENARERGRLDEAAELEVPELGKDIELEERIAEMDDELERLRLEAIERGEDPRNRAAEAGRAWTEGDGF